MNTEELLKEYYELIVKDMEVVPNYEYAKKINALLYRQSISCSIKHIEGLIKMLETYKAIKLNNDTSFCIKTDISDLTLLLIDLKNINP